MFEKFAKAVEVLSKLGIDERDLVCISLNSGGVTCQLFEECFVRLAKTLFVLELWHHECASNHFRFNVHDIEFVTVSYSTDMESQFRIIAKNSMQTCGL